MCKITTPCHFRDQEQVQPTRNTENLEIAFLDKSWINPTAKTASVSPGSSLQQARCTTCRQVSHATFLALTTEMPATQHTLRVLC